MSDDLEAARKSSQSWYWWGIPTFFRCPWNEDPAQAEIALVGVPHSSGNGSTERDQHLGPRAVRNVSGFYRRTHYVHGFAPWDVARINDLGDVPLPEAMNNEACVRDIEAFYRRLDEAGTRPVSMGGDHSIHSLHPWTFGAPRAGEPCGCAELRLAADCGASRFCATGLRLHGRGVRNGLGFRLRGTGARRGTGPDPCVRERTAHLNTEHPAFFCDRVGVFGWIVIVNGGDCFSVLCRPGSDLLFRVLRRSTIGAGAIYGRVRDGIGYGHPARATRPAKNREGSEWRGVSSEEGKCGCPLFAIGYWLLAIRFIRAHVCYSEI